MLELPRYILNSLENNKTSLGEHPSFPPEEEEKFIVNAVADKFTKLTDGIEIPDIQELKSELGKLITECRKIESKNRTALEQLCMEIVTELFSIPEDTIKIDANIVDEVNTDNQRMIPEKTTDFSFDSIDDMDYLTGEIYKRRMLNALVTGAAMYYSDNISLYIKDLFEIDPELPALYKKIIKYNEILMFFEKDKLKEDGESMEGGKVDVTMNMPQNMVSIVSEGIIFPILLEETIKGILELAIAHGLPEDRKKAEYIMKKSDFKLAELWDMRLGSALWDIIAGQTEEMDVVEPNFLLMTLAEMPSDEFNNCMKEIFGKTKRGKGILDNIIKEIISEKDRDEFNDFIKQKQDGFRIDDGYYTSEELIADDINEDDDDDRRKVSVNMFDIEGYGGDYGMCEGWARNTAMAGVLGAASLFGGLNANAQDVQPNKPDTVQTVKQQQVTMDIKQLKKMFPQAYKDRNANKDVWMKNQSKYTATMPNGKISLVGKIEASHGQNPWEALVKKYCPNQNDDIFTLSDFDI